MFVCEFCDKSLTTKSSLKLHQERTKYCIKKQASKLGTIFIEQILCQYCDKNFTHNQTRDKHESGCIVKDIKLKHNIEITEIKSAYSSEISKLNSDYTLEITRLKDKNLELEKDILKQRAEIYAELYNKDQAFILSQSAKLAERAGTTTTTTTNNTIRGRNINMNNLDLSRERLMSMKDTYTIKHYERGGAGQADWAVDNILKDDYKCTDKNRMNFIYQDENGNIVNDLRCVKLKSVITPGLDTKLKEYKKFKYSELGEVDDDDNELMERCNRVYKENRILGSEFDKRLVERTYS